MSNKNLKVAENSFFNYQQYEKTAREDIKKFVEEEFKDVTITEIDNDERDNSFELKISGDRYELYFERGYLVLKELGNTEFQNMYFDSVAECFEFIGFDNL